MEINVLGDLAVKLIKSAIHHTPCSLPEDTNFRELYFFLRRHLLSAPLYDTVKKICTDEVSLKLFKDDYMAESVQYNLFNDENERILKIFERENIDVLPIKGYDIKKYYPEGFFRCSVDTDIVFDENKSEKVKEIMSKEGYKLEFEGKKDCSYSKDSFLNYEFHKHAIESFFPAYELYKNILFSSPLNENSNFIHHMKYEDIYVFSIAHFYKHFIGSGAGIRFLLDLYFIDINLKDKIDEEKFLKMLDSLNLIKFFKKMKKLAYKLFDNEEDTRDENEKLICKYTYMQGCLGSDSGHIKRLIKEKSEKHKKFKYFFYVWYKYFYQERRFKNYPVLRKCYKLLPLCYVHRLIKCATVARKKVKKDYYAYLKYESFVDNVFSAVGI